MRARRVNIITHVHTDASSAETSILNDRITRAIRRCAGEETKIGWSECFTPIDRLEALLRRGRGDHGPVHMILVTDHMRRVCHHLPGRNLAAAARDHRLALGAELATRTRDADGAYRAGPEILAFGGRHLVEGPHGPYYGLTQALIDELYERCLDEDGQELCTRRARDLLQQRGVAHALSHPLDGHALSLEGTLNVISEFPFIETINGGFSAQSTRLLQAYVRLNNALRDGATLPEGVLSPAGRRIVDHIRRRGRRVHPLSGSDAHCRHFDRAVTSMIVPAGQPAEELRPGELFDRMLAVARGDHAGEHPFMTLGRAATARSLLADVSSIILRNFSDNLRLCKNPLVWGNIVATTIFITRDELHQRRVLQQRRIKQSRAFDPVRLLPLLEERERPARAHPAGAARPVSLGLELPRGLRAQTY